MRSRWFSVQATDTKNAASGAPICIRLGSLSGVFKAQCARQGVSVNEEIREVIARALANPDLTLNLSNEDERIRISLGSLKNEFTQWCKSRGLSASAALRILIAHTVEQRILISVQSDLFHLDQNSNETKVGSRSGQVVLGVQELEDESSRMRLRLKTSELEAVSQLAKQRRVSPQRLVTQVLRAFLLKTAAFSHQEIVDMGAVNLSLMRIGTNLNQIAKQLNAHAASQSRPGDSAYSDFEVLNQEIRQCVATLDSHVKSCAHALALSRERWRIELKD